MVRYMSRYLSSIPTRFPMHSDFNVEELGKLTYEAAADPSRWNDFLRYSAR